MPSGSISLIGSGETSDWFLNLYQSQISGLHSPHITFLDTPAGFQLNTDELFAGFAGYFKKHFNLALGLASFRNRSADPGPALSELQRAGGLIAGPGSPTYAIKHWRDTPVWQTAVERWRAGMRLIFASSATIALGRHALPVYEIYKVGDDPYWAEGLDLLGPLGYELAIIPHYNNPEGRTHDTRYCFIGQPRLLQLEGQLPASAVILGLDENTALTLDLESNTGHVSGAGRVVLRHQGQENALDSGAAFDLKHLKAAHALEPIARRAPARPQAPLASAAAGQPSGPPAKVIEWAAERDRLRAEKNYAGADRLRDEIARVGYAIKDSPAGPQLSLQRYADVGAVPSHLDQPDAVEWSVTLLAHNNAAEVLRAAKSALHWGRAQSLEVVVVDNGSDDGAAETLAELASQDERVKPVYLQANLGEAVGRNIGFQFSRGRLILLMGGHMEIAGDVFTPAAAALADDTIGATGSNGLVSTDLFTFDPVSQAEAGADADAAGPIDADAIEFYFFAFRRERLKAVGLLDEKFVFYRNLDLDWSLAFKDKGLRLVVTPGLRLVTHEHPYLRMDPAQRDRLSKKNYRRFLDKWRERKDLLLAHQPAPGDS